MAKLKNILGLLAFLIVTLNSLQAQISSFPAASGGSSSSTADISAPINHWTMENDSCTTDAGSGADDLTLVNSPTCQTSGGKVGDDFLELDGTNQYATAAITWPSNDMTVAFWTYTDSNGDRYMFAGHTSGNTTPELALRSNSSSQLSLVFNNNSSNYGLEGIVSGSSTWFHVAYVRAGAALTVYINGHPAITSFGNAVLDFGACEFIIGMEADTLCIGTPGQYWDGGFDDFRIYDRALSIDDIAALVALGS